MTKPTTKTDSPKSKSLSLLENILFVCCVIVIALRATWTEAPTIQSTQLQAAINDTVYSLSLSGVLIFAALLLLVAAILRGRCSFKISAMEIGLVVLFTGITIASLYASNKRAAITSALTLLAPLLMAMMLAKLLNSHAKIRILLIVIIALCLVAAWQSADQVIISNNVMLQQYQEDPNSILQPLGIQPGSLNQMMLEHRIYSKDVRASFTTSNSAGSFAILTSFAAIALLAELLKSRKTHPLPLANLLLAGCILAVVLFSLAITRSKGAIAAFLFAAAIFFLLLRTPKLRLSKNIILTCCVLGVLALIPFVAWYGLKFGRLPGGNSMLVRWQYWKASAQMVADHPLTGVGGGNFACAYHRYKPASAPETVSDPHCFILALLTQYGPLGLLGFLIIVLTPLLRTSLTVSNTLEKPSGIHFKKLAIPCVIISSLVMLTARYFIVPPSAAETFDEKLYVFLTDYMAPVVTFALGFVLLIKAIQAINSSGPGGEFVLHSTSVTAIALFAGLLGVLIHNLIDFAIFEPGVLTAFCAVLGCLIALDKQKTEQPIRPLSSVFRLPSSVLCLLSFAFCLFCYFNYVMLPVAKSTAKITQARRPIEIGQVSLAHSLLADATNDDPLSPDAPAMDGQLLLQRPYFPTMQPSEILDNAEEALLTAIARNPQDYRNFELLADVFASRAGLQPAQKNQWLDKALYAAAAAVELYPGDAESHLRLARLAEQLGQPDTALEHYRRAVQIEDDFREQFRIMYPGREVLSRMPSENYLLAKKRIESLQ